MQTLIKLNKAGMKTMKQQRQDIFWKFTNKCSKSPKFSQWFHEEEVGQPVNRLRNQTTNRYKPVYCRTQRFERSPIPQMIKLLNNTKNTTN